MLFALKIKNFAIIEDIELELTDGLNVLTGETGSGKSIILDALGLVLGNRASGEFIRTGYDRAFVQAVFDARGYVEINKILESNGIEPSDDRILVLTRELNNSGRNICRVNGQIIPLVLLKQIGQLLVDSQSQHEQYSLLVQARQRELLDRFGGDDLLEILQRQAELYNKWQVMVKELVRLETGARERARKIDVLEFQIEEIKNAGLTLGEEEELERERLLLSNAEKIISLAKEIYENIYEGNQSGSAVDLLGKAVNKMRELCAIDKKMEAFYESLEGVLFQLEDTARDIKAYLDNVEYDPDRLNAVEQRLVDIKSLKRKYGSSVEEVIDYYKNAIAELDNLKNYSERSETLRDETEKAEKRWLNAANLLSTARSEAAGKLEEMVSRELKELDMNKVKFKVLLKKKEHGSAEGLEDIEFLISPNPGEPLKPLAKIASGGELSRIILAIKTILAGVDRIPTLIFDEVDAGVGGQALHAVAEKIKKISRKRQVLCVTHAAQVARYAETHYRVEKEVVKDFTSVKLHLLNNEEKVEELARMLGGNQVTALTKRHAREILETAQKELNCHG